jgi:gamma-glutamyltranspeptidase/glutathione hydrolase
MVSYIQSNYQGFGSGVVAPDTGIALNNRGACFSLEPGHPNEAAGGKRSYHTIIPAFLTHQGQPVGPFGVMGGFMQPQGHVQVVTGLIDYGLNPQAALDALRWQVTGGLDVELEIGYPEYILQALAGRGHAARLTFDRGRFGRGQIIWRLAEGLLVGGSDPRSDGSAAGW